MGRAVSMAKVRVLTLLCVALVASAIAAPYAFEDEPRSSSDSDVAFEAEDEPRDLGLDEDDEDSGVELDDEEPEMRADEDDEDLELEPEVRGAQWDTSPVRRPRPRPRRRR